MKTRSLPRICVVLLVVAAFAQQPSVKRPLTHKDYDSWRSIQSPQLSRDGKRLAYALFPQEGDGEVVVRDLATGREHRQSAGALPPPPEPAPDEPGPGEQPPRRGIRLAFTHDGRFLVCSTFPSKAETDKAKKERKRPEEMPKGGLLILDLASGAATRIPGVKSFQTPEMGESLVAYLKEAKPPEKPQAKEVEEKKPAAPAARGRQRPEYGTELVLRDLRKSEPNQRSFQDVLEHALSKDGKTLVYAVASRKQEGNGVYAVSPGSDAAPAALLSGKGKYVKLTWDRDHTQLAFLSDRDEASAKPPKFKLYHWDRKAAAASELVSTATPGFRAGYVISDRGTLNFSRDGSRLFLSCGPPAPPEKDPAEAAPAEDKVVADLWHWKDDFVQPMQKVRATRERSRSFTAVFHLADKKFVQLADPSLQSATLSDDGRYAIGTDDRAYRSMVDYDASYADYYLVDTASGSRKRLLEKHRGGFGMFGSPLNWAPDGRHVLFFRDQHWHTLSVPDGVLTNLTAGLGVDFYNEEDDTPDPPRSYGTAGWTKDGQFVLLYDRYDVWQVSADAQTAKCVTDRAGRRDKLQFRVVRLDTDDEEMKVRGIDLAKPLLLRAENLETRDTGFWRDKQKLLMAAKNFRTLAKAKDADAIVLTASTFSEFPDLHVTDSSFRGPRKVSDANPQKAQLRWGTGELIRYKNADGVPLQAALYKPEDFNPAQKYPLMVYIYERLSQGLHNFVEPRPGTSINASYYVSNGYLVLTPDIVYTVGWPGQSALKCVLPAIQAVVDKGCVNENAIGIQGHSWGGYQIAYMLTQTRRFRAAEAGAPVGNMTSAYNGIRWGSGMPRQFQYERTQSRIGGSLWQYPMRFLQNSPVFWVDRVQTPLLILHDDQDDAVPWYQGIELFLSLRRLGKEVYLFNYNGELHGLRKRHNQKDYTIRMQQFFDHFLKGAPKPEWMEKGIPYVEREQEKERVQP